MRDRFAMVPRVAVVVVVALGALFLGPPSVDAAVNFFDTTKKVHGVGDVQCPAGYRVTGGGVGPLPADHYELGTSFPDESYATASDTYKILGSRPTKQGWRARVLHTMARR